MRTALIAGSCWALTWWTALALAVYGWAMLPPESAPVDRMPVAAANSIPVAEVSALRVAQ